VRGKNVGKSHHAGAEAGAATVAAPWNSADNTSHVVERRATPGPAAVLGLANRANH
jgi:hypothetical protein